MGENSKGGGAILRAVIAKCIVARVFCNARILAVFSVRDTSFHQLQKRAPHSLPEYTRVMREENRS